MVLSTIFEMLGAITVGSRAADTIKNGIIPSSAFQNNAGVQMLAFTCALATASSWVMWCTRHSAHVSSTYSLISAVAGVGVAKVGASQLQWGWNIGKGLGAIFAGLRMASIISDGFASAIFMLIKLVILVRKKPAPWAVWIPKLEPGEKTTWYLAAVTLGTGDGVALFSAIFFLRFAPARIIKKDYNLEWWMFFLGPLLFKRPAPVDAQKAKVPHYLVVYDEGNEFSASHNSDERRKMVENAQITNQQRAAIDDIAQETYKELLAQLEEKLKANLIKNDGPISWAMRTVRYSPMGSGQIYELHNVTILARRIPATIVCGNLYGMHYDIHAAQSGISGTPDGQRMQQMYSHAEKYSNEFEQAYSFIQVLTACSASFTYGANDIGNSVGPWAVIYQAWHTGSATASKAPVPVWQLAVIAGCIAIGLVTYGFNIMKVIGNKITYYFPSRGCSMELGTTITVLVFSQYSLPLSTSMCITGATVGVGLCNGTFKAIN